MQKNELMKFGDSIIRILQVKGDSVLIVNCTSKAMPSWVTKAELSAYEHCNEEDLSALTGATVADYDDLDKDSRKFAQEHYSLITGVREKIMREHGVTHDFIFIRADGNPAQVSTIRSWIEKWDKVLDKHLYCHSLRHYWTTTLLSYGLEKQFVQELQDWSSDTLVDLYNDATMKDRKWKGLDKLAQAMEEMKEIKITEEK